MSAWYICSSPGFYPVAPGPDIYQTGSPAINSATLHLENENTFSIEAKNRSDKNVFIHKIDLNGKLLNRLFLTHSEIMKGGKLVYHMATTHRR